MRRFLILSLVIMLVGVLLTSSFFILKEKKEDKEQEGIFEELEIIANNDNNEKSEVQKEEIKEQTINVEELYKINSDIVGWLKIENSNMSYPVMQTKDRPNYYLNKNFYKKYSALGTPYLAENCNIEESDNLIIYGHHIKRKASFWRIRELQKRRILQKA